MQFIYPYISLCRLKHLLKGFWAREGFCVCAEPMLSTWERHGQEGEGTPMGHHKSPVVPGLVAVPVWGAKSPALSPDMKKLSLPKYPSLGGTNSALFLGNFWLQDRWALCMAIISRQILLTRETHLRVCLCVCCFYEKVHMPFRFCYFRRADDLRNRMKSWHRWLFSWPALNSRWRLVLKGYSSLLYTGGIWWVLLQRHQGSSWQHSAQGEKGRLGTWQVLIIHQCSPSCVGSSPISNIGISVCS